MAKPDGSAEPLILLESKEEFQQEHGEVLDLENHMDKSVTTYRDNQDRPKHIKVKI